MAVVQRSTFPIPDRPIMAVPQESFSAYSMTFGQWLLSARALQGNLDLLLMVEMSLRGI